MSEFLSDDEELITPEDYYKAAKKIEERALLKCKRYQVYCQFEIFKQLEQMLPDSENQVRWKWLTDYNRNESEYFKNIYPESIDYSVIESDISLPSCHSVDPEPLREESLPLSAGQDLLFNNVSPLRMRNLEPIVQVKSNVPKFAELDMVTYMNLPISENNNEAQPHDIPVEIPSSPPPACLEDFAQELNPRLADHIYENKGFNSHGLFNSSKLPIECLREAPQAIYEPAPFLPLNKPSNSRHPGSAGLLGSGGFGSEYDNPLILSFSSIGDNDHTTKTQHNIMIKQDQSHISISDDAPAEHFQPSTLYTPTEDAIKDSPPDANAALNSEPVDQPHTDTHQSLAKDLVQENLPYIINIPTSEPEDQNHVYTQQKTAIDILLDHRPEASTAPVSESDNKPISYTLHTPVRDVIHECYLDDNIIPDSKPTDQPRTYTGQKSTSGLLKESCPNANTTPASELGDQTHAYTNHTPTKNIIQKQLPGVSTVPSSQSVDQPHIHTHTITNSPQTPRIIPTPESPKRSAAVRKSSNCIIKSNKEPDTIQESPSRSPILTRSRSKSQVPGNLAPELLTEYRIAEMRQMANAVKYEFNDSALVNTMQAISHDESYIRIGDNLHDARYFDQEDIKKTLDLLQSTKQPMCPKRPGRPMTSPLKRTKDCFSLSVAKRIEWIEPDVNDNDPAIRKRFRAPKKPSSKELVKYNHAIEINNVKKLQTRKSKDQE